MGNIMKILVIGYSGSGKSTLTQHLSDYYQIPKLHLDQIFFEPNWQPRPEKEFVKTLEDFLLSNQEWIMDGVYSRYLFEKRLELADQIIFLNFPRWASFGRILKRYLRFRGKIRPSAPEGCHEKLDWAFIKFTLFTSRQPKRQKMFKEICQKYQDKTILLKSQKEINVYLHHLEIYQQEKIYNGTV